MPLSNWIIVVGLGKLLQFTLRKFPLTTWIKNKNAFLKELIECDFCLGVWIYTILFLLFGGDVLKDTIIHIPVISEFLSGVVTSFLVMLLTDGWKARFEIIRV